MKKEHGIFQRLMEETEIHAESVPGQSILELAGDRRVLIEQHFGVIQYHPECIGVKVKFGQILIRGCAMELTQLSRQQLVISGRIDNISLIRRC